jgi:hypothetical protein
MVADLIRHHAQMLGLSFEQLSAALLHQST